MARDSPALVPAWTCVWYCSCAYVVSEYARVSRRQGPAFVGEHNILLWGDPSVFSAPESRSNVARPHYLVPGIEPFRGPLGPPKGGIRRASSTPSGSRIIFTAPLFVFNRNPSNFGPHLTIPHTGVGCICCLLPLVSTPSLVLGAEPSARQPFVRTEAPITQGDRTPRSRPLFQIFLRKSGRSKRVGRLIPAGGGRVPMRPGGLR